MQFSSLYLAAYNLCCVVLWGRILWIALWNFDNGSAIYAEAGSVLRFAQGISVMEVLHSVSGLVNGSSLPALMQVLARLVHVFLGISVVGAEYHNNVGFFLILVTWCLADISRYLLYLTKLFNKEIAFLTLFRYNAFIVLYPAGLGLELWLQWFAFVQYKKEGNSLCFGIPLWSILCVVGFRSLYAYMFKQRGKFMHLQTADGKKAK
eukprot:CAMPEP_0175130430 /NCGR_PEP_ID=MMETSP0087-20121206/6002_1 /TAXON_ID=136419 /ORGANISM="Unknown Unknown, Strain D1" /LENGTH=206 /DNA_ID=CAMNT_0016412647 /DNA_START=17 /DNA_END=637 /DNA_ORIENTATION=-